MNILCSCFSNSSRNSEDNESDTEKLRDMIRKELSKFKRDRVRMNIFFYITMGHNGFLIARVSNSSDPRIQLVHIQHQHF